MKNTGNWALCVVIAAALLAIPQCADARPKLIARKGDHIYRISDDGTLYRGDPAGNFVQFGPKHTWVHSKAICADDRNVYIEQYGTISTINLIDGTSWNRFCRVGPGLLAMTAHKGVVYAVVNTVLLRITKEDFRPLNPGSSWAQTDGMCFMDGQVWIIQRCFLHLVDPNTGGYKWYKFHRTWCSVTLMFADDERKCLYVEQKNDAFYRIYPYKNKVEALLTAEQLDNPPNWATSVRAAARLK